MKRYDSDMKKYHITHFRCKIVGDEDNRHKMIPASDLASVVSNGAMYVITHLVSAMELNKDDVGQVIDVPNPLKVMDVVMDTRGRYVEIHEICETWAYGVGVA